MDLGVKMASKSGLQDWIIQRATALYILLYTIGLGIVLFQIAPITYVVWVDLFQNPIMQIASSFVWICILYHTWIGLWIIATDYMPNVAVRMSFYLLVIFALGYYFIFGIKILWGL